ncbi:sulfotransferase domain-containing protein [Roseospirillum parvum]|nr:sulfotransferase domain-containing protein [Roseospirillum parvum]
MHDSSFIVRIGHFKCGTTFFNQAFFPQHPQINFLGKPFPQGDAMWTVLEQIAGLRDFDAAFCRGEVAARLETGTPERRLAALSDGRFAEPRHPDFDHLPERLKQVTGPNTLILFTVRHPVDLVASLYTQSVGTGKTRDSFQKWLDDNWADNQDILGMISYGRVAETFARTFGAERLLINSLETLRAEPAAFARDLAHRCGLDEARTVALFDQKPRNRRMSRLQTRLSASPALYGLARRLWHALPDGLRPLAGRLSGHGQAFVPEIPASVRHRILDSSRPEIERLCAVANLPAARLGFDLDAPPAG